ncbi:DUF6270 domain-containing protein [Isoptericola jiangsuensis]|uniref:DUF6270 domain-containing protein n=1 Tax=Isoptericola jiangsuensis TaxID=548579 RepID=UPI003AAD6AF3
MTRQRVFIYGSCVSRDTFTRFDPHLFRMIDYVARQSALSAGTPPVTAVEPPVMDSPFQQRMVSGDFASNLQHRLAKQADLTDLVLIDLTDERLGVHLLPDGTVVTRSPELIASGAEQDLPGGTRHLKFGAAEHRERWAACIDVVGDLLRHHLPGVPVALLDVPWAARSESGAAPPDSFGMTADRANPVLRDYADMAARALGADLIRVRPDAVSSSPHHRWGDAPFHYTEAVYLRLVRRISGTAGRPVQSDVLRSGTRARPQQADPRPAS